MALYRLHRKAKLPIKDAAPFARVSMLRISQVRAEIE
jgi:hypothetical protein